MKNLFGLVLLLGAHGLWAQLYPNIIITSSKSQLHASEPSLAIDPLNPSRMMAGSVLHAWHFSNDGGETWQSGQLKSSLGVWGDPCIVADREGAFYYFHLSDVSGKGWGGEHFLDRIVCQRTEDAGDTWTKGSSIGQNRPKVQDKEWAAISADGKRLMVSWTEFDKYKSADPNDRSRILISFSDDRGESWTPPKVLSQQTGDCLDGDGTAEGAVPAAGINGEVYVAWGRDGKLWLQRSQDGGLNWLDKEIRLGKQKGGWDQEVAGFSRINGMPVTKTDLSQGPYRGHVYVLYSAQNKKHLDVFLLKSTDGGKKWSKPIKVNQDKSKTDQFLPWLAVDPSTGYLYAVYYDRHGLVGNATAVSLAISRDGGLSWTNERISEKEFYPSSEVFIGDYNNIDAVNGVIRPIWVELHQGVKQIKTAIINLQP